MLEKFFSVKNTQDKKHRIVTVCGAKLKLKNKKSVDSKFTTIHYVIAILKAYGIKNIVASPGMQNAMFN